MKLEVRLFATLREYLPGKEVAKIEMPEGSNVGDLINKLEIPQDISLIIMINGKREPETAELKDGDRVGIFPPVGGG